jgi:hypothetical protein
LCVEPEEKDPEEEATGRDKRAVGEDAMELR